MTRQVLIVRGGWEGHRPVEATDMFVPFLKSAGFEVRIEGSPQIYADAAVMAATDLVLQCISMSEISPEALAGLRRAVEAGTGFGGWHGGIVDSFRTSSDYLQLTGGQFASHPGRPAAACTGGPEDNFLPYTVAITALGRTHPITAGIGDFDLVTEQYWVLHDDLIDVLATTTHPAPDHQPWSRPVLSPAIWTRRWGQGRIFVATPGHDLPTLQIPQVTAVIERGLQWAARTESA